MAKMNYSTLFIILQFDFVAQATLSILLHSRKPKIKSTSLF